MPGRPAAFAYLEAERYDEAPADYSRAIELDPNYAFAVVNRGVTYDRMGRPDEARWPTSAAIQLDPRYGLTDD